uniref:Transmembrane 131 like n=1 Tax=Mastacembelus armatus TaxID=205130 RepID=A0A7N8XC00_9TELE
NHIYTQPQPGSSCDTAVNVYIQQAFLHTFLSPNNNDRMETVKIVCVSCCNNIFSYASSLCQVIPPRGKASFKLIFLPSEEGNVENTLFINTSANGLLSYQVSSVNAPPIFYCLILYILYAHYFCLVFFPTGEPKIGVYMLNSGGKKLYIKVRFSLFFLKRCLSFQDMRVLSKVDASLEFHQVPLRPEAKNFTEVATLSCRGELNNFFSIPSTRQDLRLMYLLPPICQVMNFSSPLTVPQGCWRIVSLQLLSRGLPVNQLFTLSLDTSLGSALHIPLYFHSTPSKVKGLLPEAGRSEWQRSLLPDFAASSWAIDSKLAAELCSRWQNHKDKLPCRSDVHAAHFFTLLPVETSSPLDFGATPVNESKVKTFMLKNPSSSVISLEIRILSLYPAPLEALDLLTKWYVQYMLISENYLVEIDFLLQLCVDAGENQDIKGERVLRLLLQPWETREVAVVFTPSEHKSITTILIIRNNLTVFDMVMVKGHGAKELLRVGGKLPGLGASLRFNVPQSTLMECRLRTNKPLFAIRKSFKVENAGELPLTVMSMNINGYKCQGFGFEVLQCRSFSLDHNTSSEITIAFTPDFTSSWVIRDLTLVTSRGTSFPFTLNVTLPHHMLPLCAQVVPGPSWEETFWVVTLIFTCFSLFGVCLMAFHQAQYILNEFSAPSIRSNHNCVLSRDNRSVNSVTPNGGSCKSYVDTCHTSDKGKGRGSPALANGPPLRPQVSKKGSSTTPSQPQKKHKVSLYYTKYKSSSSTVGAGGVTMDEEHEDLTMDAPLTPDPDICNNNEPAFISELDKKMSTEFKEDPHSTIEDRVPATVMFPVEMPAGFPNNVTVGPGPRPGFSAFFCCNNFAGNGTFSSSFPVQEGQNVHSTQTRWTEEQPQESPSTWDTAACVGSKPYFSGTRSLSPMSSLFGSIWTPQSEPYRSHYQPERSAPMSPVSPVTPPHSPFIREPEGPCGPTQYSSFNPFGPHMNLDIWNSSSNRSSNSQLSNDSGYCGDV